MIVTTKNGDKKTTNILFSTKKYPKTDQRFEVCGAVDELNAALGIARSNAKSEKVKEGILYLQKKLFVIASQTIISFEDLEKLKERITKDDIEFIESEIRYLENITTLSDWFIPGEHLSSSSIEMARTISRRLERELLRLDNLDENIQIYSNRISDYIWLLSQEEERVLKKRI